MTPIATETDELAAPATPAKTLRAPVSVLILTRDEEINIGPCLEGLSFSDDIVILDSVSTDRTTQIARSFPHVRVVERPFDTEYLQRNFGLREIAYKYPWVYICDADERMPESLVREIAQKVTAPESGPVAYRLRYKNMFRGKWIKHATTYPVWIIRLVRPEKVTYEVRQTNVHPIADGAIGELDGHFIHYSFNTGLKRWFAKHNFYSDREAIEAVDVRKRDRPKLGELFQRDPFRRRRAAKNMSFFLGGRALLRFLYSYVLRLGFLDGLAGFHYCAMISMYEYWIGLKVREQERPWVKRNEEVVASLLKE